MKEGDDETVVMKLINLKGIPGPPLLIKNMVQ